MAKERGSLMPILNNFLQSLRILTRPTRIKLIGEDYNGTKYFEDLNAKYKRGRSFEPKDPDNFEQEVPAEWESWLRYRRRDPPTDEEVRAGLAMIEQKRRNAAQLAAQHAQEKSKSLEIASAKPAIGFPTYDDYKDYGRDYKVKYKNKNED